MRGPETSCTVWKNEAAACSTYWALHSKLAHCWFKSARVDRKCFQTRREMFTCEQRNPPAGVMVTHRPSQQGQHVRGRGRRYGQRKSGHRYRRQRFDWALQMTGCWSFFQSRSQSFTTTWWLKHEAPGESTREPGLKPGTGSDVSGESTSAFCVLALIPPFRGQSYPKQASSAACTEHPVQVTVMWLGQEAMSPTWWSHKIKGRNLTYSILHLTSRMKNI